MIPFQAGSAKVVAVDRQLRDRDIFLAENKDRLLQAQTMMKATYDKHLRDMEFVVGDWVWLRLNHRSATTIREGIPSWDPSTLGPIKFWSE
jgi:hypothetical protein